MGTVGGRECNECIVELWFVSEDVVGCAGYPAVGRGVGRGRGKDACVMDSDREERMKTGWKRLKGEEIND